MKNSLENSLRFYYYTVTTLALFYLAFWLQDFLDQVLLNHGLTDTLTLAGVLDLISNLPIFGDWRWAIGALVVGAVHWFLIFRDRQKTEREGDDTSLIRAAFLSVVMGLLGLRVLFAIITIIQEMTYPAQATLPNAATIAGLGAWGLAAGLVYTEWRVGGEFKGGARNIALGSSLVGQWMLAIASVSAIALLVQSALQNIVAPLPECSQSLDVVTQLVTFVSRLFQTCTDTPPPLDAALTAGVILGAWFVFTRWSSAFADGGLNGIFTNIDAVVGALIVSLSFLYGAVLGMRFLFDKFSGQPGVEAPRSLLSTPGAFGLASYPFIGALIAGLSVFGVYFYRERKNKNTSDDPKVASAFRSSLVTVAICLALTLLVGASWLLGDVFVALLPSIGLGDGVVSPGDWSLGVMLAIPGAILGFTPLLAEKGKPALSIFQEMDGVATGYGRVGVSLAGRMYVRLLSIGISVFILSPSLAALVAVVGTDALSVSLDFLPFNPISYIAPHLAGFIVISGIYLLYFWTVARRLRNK